MPSATVRREVASRRTVLIGGVWPLMAMGRAGRLSSPLSSGVASTAMGVISPRLPDEVVGDWGAAIQAAIDAAGAAGGGRVYLPAGNYEISSKLELRSGVILCGDGHATRLFTTQTGLGQPTIVRAEGIRDFAIEDINLQGSGINNNETTYAVSITDGCYSGRVVRCFVSRAYIGIYVGDVSKKPSSNILVSGNQISDVGLNGIGVNSGGEFVRVIDNNISRCGSVASISNIGAGIEYRSGRIGACSNNIVVDCSFGDPGCVDGIRLENGSDPAMPDSKIVCSGNVISGFSGCGIRGQMLQDSVISDNIISGDFKSQTGILIYSSSRQGIVSERVIVSNNLIMDIPTGHGIRLEGDAGAPVKNCTVKGSIVSNCDVGALLVAADQNLFIGNRYISSRSRGVFVVSGSHNSFSSEHASGGKIGFQVRSGVGNTFVECVAVANSMYGLVSSPGPRQTLVRGGVFDRNGTAKVVGVK